MKRVLIVILLSTASGFLFNQSAARTDQNPGETDDKVYEPKQVDTSVKILSKPDPQYTFEASRQHVVGMVRLTAVFTANGEIRNIQVVNGLPAGLTENATEAAQKITFTPAMKEGRAVSVRMMIIYTFELMEKIIHGQRVLKVFYEERCRDYTNIAAEDMVFFTSEKEAKKAGYRKSKNCP